MKRRCLSLLLAVFATNSFGGGVGGGGNPPAVLESQDLMRIISDFDFSRIMMSSMGLLPVTAEDFAVDSTSTDRSAVRSEFQADTDSE